MPKTRTTLPHPVIKILSDLNLLPEKGEDVNEKSYLRALMDGVNILSIESLSRSGRSDSRIKILQDEVKRVRAADKEREKVVPKIKKTKISAAAFKKGTSQDIKPNNEVTSLAIRKPRPDVTASEITPETLEEETVVEPKQPSLGEGFKNILNSIAGSTESIKNLLLGQQEADKQAAKDVKRKTEDSKRKGKEKKIESRVFDGLKKVGEKIISPVKGLLGQIWKFIQTLFLSAVVGKLIDWFQNPENQQKVQSVFRFIKDWWPALLTGFLLFGTGIGSLITGTVGAIASFIPTLVGMLPGLLAFLASPIGLAVLGTAAVVGGGMWVANKMKGDGDDKKIEGSKTEKFSPIKESNKNKETAQNNLEEAGGSGIGVSLNFNKGGSVPGQGNTDTVPAMLTPGEFVLTKEATEKYGTDTLESMNAAAASGKKETSGTGRLIGSTIGGLTGAVVGFFADTPVSPAADIALGMAGSAAGGEIGDNIERKLTGKGDSATKATQSFRNGGLVQYLNNGGRVTGKDKEGQEAYMLHWVNKERELQGLPPLKKLTYAQGVYLTKAIGPGPIIDEQTNTYQDFDRGVASHSKSRTVDGKTSFIHTMSLLTEEDRKKYLEANPKAKKMMELQQQLELDALGLDISETAKPQKFNKGGLVQHLNNGGRVYTQQEANAMAASFDNRPLARIQKLRNERDQLSNNRGSDGKLSRKDRKRWNEISAEINALQNQIIASRRGETNKSNSSGEKRRSISNKSQKNPANFLQPKGFESKKGGGLGRLIGGIADIATLGMFDFDNKSGGGLLRKVVGGTADALTGNRWDFDNQGKPEVKSEPPKISGKLKPADITPPVVGGAAGKPNITTMNLNDSGAPIPLGGGNESAPPLPDFSPIAMRSRDKIKTLGIMV